MIIFILNINLNISEIDIDHVNCAVYSKTFDNSNTLTFSSVSFPFLFQGVFTFIIIKSKFISCPQFLILQNLNLILIQRTKTPWKQLLLLTQPFSFSDFLPFCQSSTFYPCFFPAQSLPSSFLQYLALSSFVTVNGDSGLTQPSYSQL